MTSAIEASANALKLSYKRFVSDAAPGLLLIGTLLILERKGRAPFPVLPNDPALQAVAAIVLILLAHPWDCSSMAQVTSALVEFKSG